MIKAFDYRRSLAWIRQDIIAAIDRVLHSGKLLFGPETEAFEREFAQALGVRHCVAVASGTAALQLALTAVGVGPGDEVITVANTCVPTIAAIYAAGARPVYVDVRPDDLMMDVSLVERAIGPRTRCVLPVHLWGGGVDMSALAELAERHGLALVEDCAQAHFTRIAGRWAGAWGLAGCFSFYPTKNIGSYGDAGAVVVDRPELAERLRRLRYYGFDRGGLAVEPGLNARISELQAAILRVKLSVYPSWLARRQALADVYRTELDHPSIRQPYWQPDVEPSFHQYVVRCADRALLASRLQAHGIEYGIHYPVPLHHMPGYTAASMTPVGLPITERAATEVLSLPLHEALSDAEVQHVAAVVNQATSHSALPRAA
jgi:aminotransferase EvaB